MTKLRNSTIAKAASIAVGLMTAASLLAPALAGAQTTADLTTQINALLAQIAALQAQIAGGPSVAMACTFTRSLFEGVSGSDVMCLQKYLNSAGFTVSTSGAGSPGNETSYYGSRTRAAVVGWQAANGVAPAAGYFGPISQARYNALLAAGPAPTPTPTPGVAGSLTVTAGAQPANSLAPQSAARIPFTTFTVMAGGSDVTITGVNVQRTGLAQDAVFSGVALLDSNGLQLGIARTLNSNHQTTVGETVSIPAGQSRTFTVAGNMNSSLSSYSGQVVSLSVIGINTTATVNGTLPITGASHTVNSTLTLGAATLVASSFDPLSATTKNVGDVNVKFAGIRITAGSSEAIRIRSIRWNQSGSAGASDLANLSVIIDGTSYPVVVSTDGKYLTAIFGSGIILDKGLSKDAYVQGDLVGGSAANRTVEFDLYKSTDLYVTGEIYGYGIIASANGNCATATTANSEFVYSAASCTGTAGTPFFSGSVITVNAGSATTITKANEVPAQNIAVNIPNQVLGGYVADINGEAISIQSHAFTIATTSGFNGSGPITNISIYDGAGAVVAGPIDEASTCTTGCTITFTDTITYPVGRHIYTIKGKIPANVTNNATVAVSATPSSGWTNVTGQVTGNSISLSGNGAFTMNTMTIRAAALVVTVSSDPVAQNVVAGSQSFLFSKFQLDATQSGEDIRVTNLPVTLTYAGTSVSTDLSSCALYDGGTVITTGSNVFNPIGATTSVATKTFTFDNSINATKGTVKTIDLKCNVAGSATSGGTYAFGITATQIGTVSATGVSSSGTVTPTGSTKVGQIMTVSSAGSLVVSTDPSSPSYTIASAGSTGVLTGVYKFRATNEDINLERIGLALTNTASSSSSDLTNVYLYDGSTLIGTAVFVGSEIRATSTLSTPIKVTRDSDKRITVKIDLANIGTSQIGTEGHLIAVDVDVNGAASNGNTKGTGAQSGTAINASGSTAVSGTRLFKSFPVLALDTLPGSGVSDGRLMRFKVTADAKGDISIEHFSLALATTSALVTNVNIFGFTDSAYSQPITGLTGNGQLLASNLCASGCSGNAPTLVFYAQTPAAASTTIQVPAGATRYFEARATVAVVGSATAYSVVSTLKGDSSYPSLSGTPAASAFVAPAGTTTVGSQNFVWSPNATTSASVTDNDWTNGFAVQGLPSSGLIQYRSN